MSDNKLSRSKDHVHGKQSRRHPAIDRRKPMSGTLTPACIRRGPPITMARSPSSDDCDQWRARGRYIREQSQRWVREDSTNPSTDQTSDGVLILVTMHLFADAERTKLKPQRPDEAQRSVRMFEDVESSQAKSEVKSVVASQHQRPTSGTFGPEFTRHPTFYVDAQGQAGSFLEPFSLHDGPQSLLVPRTISLRCEHEDAADAAVWALHDLLEVHVDNADSKQRDASTNNLLMCRAELELSVRGRSQLEVHLFLRAVSFVAVSFRLLNERELFAAVVDTFDRSEPGVTAPGRTIMLSNSNDLMRLCSCVLETNKDGSVDFSRSLMRRFLLDSEFLNVQHCHEAMTRTCLQHIQQTEIRTILQPWTNFWHLTNFALSPFFNYAKKYWPKHYRAAETDKNDLPHQLHEMVELAIVAEHPKEQGYLNIEIRKMTLEACLSLSVRHGFQILEKFCRRAGAEEASRIPFLRFLSDCQVQLCLKHSKARFSKVENTLCSIESWNLKQAKSSAPTGNSEDSFDAKSISESADRIFSSEDGWVLIRPCELELCYEFTSKNGQCIECLTAEFQSIALEPVARPVITDERSVEGAQELSCRTVNPGLENADHMNASEVRMTMQDEAYDIQPSQRSHNLSDWYIVDGGEFG